MYKHYKLITHRFLKYKKNIFYISVKHQDTEFSLFKGKRYFIH
jgi:hypothetical protein